MKKKCKKCGSELYQAEDLKWFCLLCLAKEIEERDQEDEVGGTWKVLDPKTRPVTLRLSEVDLAKAKAKARELRKPYQTLLKEVIHEALSRS
jgi:predicted DNA binding CopG/RHH family protein